jgi:hypothetical protein
MPPDSSAPESTAVVLPLDVEPVVMSSPVVKTPEAPSSPNATSSPHALVGAEATMMDDRKIAVRILCMALLLHDRVVRM